MNRMSKKYCFYCLFSLFIFKLPVSEADSQKIPKNIEIAERSQKPSPTNRESNISKPLSCEELSDGFCKTLWSAENQGNFQFSDGTQILYGERRKNVINHAKFIYNQKLAKNRCNLPEDIKSLMGIHCEPEDKKEDLLAKFGTLLSQVDSIKQNKKSVESWHRSINKILLDFDYIIKDAAYERNFKENPNLSEKFWEDYTPAEKKIYNRNYYDIKTEVINSIYLKDPDWLRVKKIFSEAKVDVLAVIEKMAFSPKTKQTLKEKVNSVRLSLPYEDPRTMNLRPSCTKYEKNGFYIPINNTLSICIGFINTVHNEGALYRFVVHEISHSIDPYVFLKDIFKQSSLAHTLGRLYESNASLASLSCEEWERQKSETFILPSEIYQLPEGLATMDQCLVDRQDLKQLNLQSLSDISKLSAEASISAYADRDMFSYLISPSVRKQGSLKKNEFYLEPKFYAESNNEHLEDKYFLLGYFHNASVFVREYKCRRLSQPDKTKKQAFSEALKETKKMNTVYHTTIYSILGRNARDLVNYNLAKPSNEDFADWVSYRALELKLQRLSSLKSRREFILADTALYCQPEGLESIAKHTILIERNYSRNFHSPDRNRRLGNFTPKTADLLQCNRGEDIKKLDKNCDFLMENL